MPLSAPSREYHHLVFFIPQMVTASFILAPFHYPLNKKKQNEANIIAYCSVLEKAASGFSPIVKPANPPVLCSNCLLCPYPI